MMKKFFIVIFNNKGKQHQKGQSLVELALTMTLLLTLLAGAFDLGNAFFDYIALRDAAQEGALYGSIDPTNEGTIVERIQYSSLPNNSSATPALDFRNFVNDCSVNSPNGICISFLDDKRCSGSEITVTLRYHYQLTMPFIGAILGTQSIPLHATVTNVVLGELCP